MDRTKLNPSSDQAGSVPRWHETLRGLAQRVLGAEVTFTQLDGDGRRYSYESRHGELSVAATDGVSAAVGLHHYLRNVCGLSVGWDTQLPLPLKSLPDCSVAWGEARVSEFYYLNFCTFSYTMPYWDWTEWEREIDWMALHGITMPLALTGHEAVLRTAYSRLGLSDDVIRHFLGGPGYLPFQYMGCLDGFAGPLPSDWISAHQELGSKILERERAFGMTPVLPAFTGHIPRSLGRGRVMSRDWQGFETCVLDAADPLYAEVGAEITRAQIELFGTDHLYAADPFIEMIPVDADPSYPGTVAAATLAGLRAADPDAVWLMQAWPFSYQRDFWTDDRVVAFLDAIPDDRLIVADLWAERDPQWERFEAFAGKTWLWCALLNFGGRTDPVADLRAIPPAVDAALSAPHPPDGLGLTMEATHNNPAFFELVADQAWTHVTSVESWLDSFVAQRYGPTDQLPLLRAAWSGLLATVYAARDVRVFPSAFHGVLTSKPSYSWDLPAVRSEIDAALWYDPAILADAWDQLITAAAGDAELAAGPLGHDLMEVAIAFMTRVADRYYLDLLTESVDRGSVDPARVTRFLDVFTDLDRLLATHPDFSLSHWESKALHWATPSIGLTQESEPGDRAVLLDNARRILTSWGPITDPHLDDYAARHWSGLVGTYYRARWSTWADHLTDALTNANDARASLDSPAEADLNSRLEALTNTFLHAAVPTQVAGLQPLPAESRHLHTTYAHAFAPGADPARPHRHR